MTKPAFIDTDFLNHLVESRWPDDLFGLIVRFFEALDVSPQMHPFVHKNEAIKYPTPIVVKLFAAEKVVVPELDIILNKYKYGARYYETLVRNIYKDFMGAEYPCKDVFSEWKDRCSLGEVHTAVMCVLLGFTLFYSDDKDAKMFLSKVVRKQTGWQICIKNRNDCCIFLSSKDCRSLNHTELNSLGHSR